MANKAKHAFGQSTGIDAAKQANKIDAFDILFLDGDTAPKVGWLDAQGNTVIVDHRPDLAKVEAELEGQIATKANAEDITQLESELAKKADVADVDAKLEAALAEYHANKYEIANAPDGTLINYNEREIRICCPANSVWTKQTVGEGGDPDCYYVTLKTYVYNDNVVGYKEHLGKQVDAEILTDLKTDKYGRKYQSTWLGVAKYDKTSDTWTYYGASSTKDKYIGWDYQIDFFDANGAFIASDSIRINLSNEDCHFVIKPYYGVSEMTEVETKIDDAVESANAYTDKKIAEVESAYEIVEF